MPRDHFRGKYVIRTEWRGSTLLYDVLTRNGLFVAVGFDMLSRDERTAVEAIVCRLSGRAKEQQHDSRSHDRAA
jgi:hypothetical protein